MQKRKNLMMALSPAMKCADVALWFLDTALVAVPGMRGSE